MKKIVLVLSLASVASSFACTTIIVGKNATTDGSILVARNDDGGSANSPAHLVYHQPRAKGYLFSSVEENKYSYQLPDNLMGYTGMPDWSTRNTLGGGTFEEVGFNDAGVGISATETIFSNSQTLKVDPYLDESGIVEEAIPSILLPQIKSARQGVEMLGKIIETTGSGEGFGVVFVDSKEAWYLENAGGHQWLAVRVPDNAYLVSGNQSRLGEVDLKDSKNYLASPSLITFAEQNGLYNPKTDGKFNFHKVYGKNDTTNPSIYKNDITYNYQRVISLQGKYTPSTLKHPVSNGDFAVFLKPEHKLSVADVESGLQSYYQGTSMDPYTSQNPQSKYRPIAVFRTQQSHVMQVREKLPAPIANVAYINLGMTALSVYVPFYQGAIIPDYYQIGGDKADDTSAFWKFRKLQTLAMQNFPKYAPIVQAGFAELNQQIEKQQKDFEKQYVKAYAKDPKAAQQLLDNFTNQTQQQVFGEVDKLTNQIITDMTNQVNTLYHFEGA